MIEIGIRHRITKGGAVIRAPFDVPSLLQTSVLPLPAAYCLIPAYRLLIPSRRLLRPGQE
jgi:hypothetical protein